MIQSGCQGHSGHKSAARAFNISFHTGNLAGEEAVFPADHLEGSIQETRAVEECVAVHDAVTRKFRMLQTGNQSEHALLLSEFQAGLKTDKIVHCVGSVILAKLDNRKRFFSGPRIGKAYRFHRTEGGDHKPAFGHLHGSVH